MHKLRTRSIAIICWLFTCAIARPVAAQKEGEVLKNWFLLRHDDQALYRHITKQAFDYLDRRSTDISKIRSLAGWKKRQEWIRKTLDSTIGPFPERTPLNAICVKKIQKNGFHMEHILFESQPGFYVTSTLFVPGNLSSKAPAIVYCSGHSPTGYRADPYQQAILNLVKKGFIVFAFDPVGQGERVEYLDEGTGKSRVGSPTREHDMPGIQAFLTGSSQARYMIWDGIRAVDYLVSRPEVDITRIGMTGRSGGGTQTAFIGAMDDRILAAAPECYITNFTRLLQSLGPPDAEQNIPGIIQRGFDEPDFLIARAPKPTLLIATLNDYFNIQGARDTYEEVSRTYQAYGRPENFRMAEDTAPHASTLRNREAMYKFFQSALRNPGNSAEEAVTLIPADELRITATGQLSSSKTGETVFSLNSKYADQLLVRLKKARENTDFHLQTVLKSAKQLSGYINPDTSTKPVFVGTFRTNGMAAQKYFLRGEGEYVIPYLVFVPENPTGKALLYLDPKGKSSVLESEQGKALILSLVKAGCHVLVPDLVGTGETGPGQWAGGTYFAHAQMNGLGYDMWYGAQLIGRSLVGIRAGDVVKLAALLKRNGMSEIAGYACREFSPILLHAAAFYSGLSRVVLEDPYLSYHSLTRQKYYNLDFVEGSVRAALTAYDLPDLAALLAPRRLLMLNVTNGRGEKFPVNKVLDEMKVTKNAYALKGSSEFKAFEGEGGIEQISLFFNDWLK